MRDPSSFFAQFAGIAGVGLGLVLLTVSAPGAAAAAEPASKPYSVFVGKAGEVDPVLDGRLANAALAVEAQLGASPKWFRLVESAEEARIRVTVFDAQAVTGELRYVGGPGALVANRYFESRGRDHFSFQAVVRVNGDRRRISGSGAGATEVGSYRDAADDFLRQLELFAGESVSPPR